jgi:DNA-binding NarL/FixJ family response regulator
LAFGAGLHDDFIGPRAAAVRLPFAQGKQMPITPSIKILLLYRDPLVRAGLAATLAGHASFELVEAPAPVFDPSGALRHPKVDVVVADYEHGLQALSCNARRAPDSHCAMPAVLIVTQRDSEWEIRHALECGTRGYLVLGCGLDELVQGVQTVYRGMRHIGAPAARRLADSIASCSLTSRETDVLRLVAEGQGNKAIARHLAIASGTVKTHLKAIFEKLNARSRTEVAAVAERRGLLASFSTDVGEPGFAPRTSHRYEGRSPSMFTTRPE